MPRTSRDKPHEIDGSSSTTRILATGKPLLNQRQSDAKPRHSVLSLPSNCSAMRLYHILRYRKTQSGALGLVRNERLEQRIGHCLSGTGTSVANHNLRSVLISCTHFYT